MMDLKEKDAIDKLAATERTWTLICIYCGTRAEELLMRSPESRAFIDLHEEQCGPKAVGAMIDVKQGERNNMQ